MPIDPISLGLGAVGAVTSLYGGYKQEKAQKAYTQQYEQEQQRQQALRSRVAGYLQPEIAADISGMESPSIQQARERYEGLQREQLGQSGALRRQSMIDRLARMGGARGRTAADITAPAASRTITNFEAQERRGMRDLAIKLAMARSQQAQALRQSGMSRALQVGQFESGGFVPAPMDQTGAQIAQGGGSLLQQSLAEYFASQRPQYQQQPYPNAQGTGYSGMPASQPVA